MKPPFSLIFVIGVLLAACQGQTAPVIGTEISAAGGVYHSVDAAGLKAMLQNKDFVFVNVHIPFEGDIAGTDLSIPYDQITAPGNLSQLPVDKDAKIVLYCRSGRMSALAAQDLVALGYTNIWDLAGGMVGWERAGYDLQK